MFLNTGDFEIRIDLFIGLNEIAFLFNPFESAAQIPFDTSYDWYDNALG